MEYGYRFDEVDSETESMVIVGIGPIGVAVLEHFDGVEKQNLSLLACFDDSSVQQGFSISNTVLCINYGQGDEQEDQRLADALTSIVGKYTTVLLIAEPTKDWEIRAMILTAQLVNRLHCPSVALLTSPTSQTPSLSQSYKATVQALARVCNGMMIFDSSEEAISAKTLYLARSVHTLMTMCINVGMRSADVSDMTYVARAVGTITVTEHEGAGAERSQDALAQTINELKQRGVAMSRVNRILIHMSCSPSNHLLMREQYDFMQGIEKQIGTKPGTLLKLLYHEEEGLGDRLKLTLLLWVEQPD